MPLVSRLLGSPIVPVLGKKPDGPAQSLSPVLYAAYAGCSVGARRVADVLPLRWLDARYPVGAGRCSGRVMSSRRVYQSVVRAWAFADPAHPFVALPPVLAENDRRSPVGLGRDGCTRPSGASSAQGGALCVPRSMLGGA